jgi:heat shock protein HslJ
MKQAALIFSFCTILFGASSCSHNPVCPDDVTDTTERETLTLTGTSWKLHSIGGESFSYGVSRGEQMRQISDPFLLKFGADTLLGQAPVNSFATSYKAIDQSIFLNKIAWSDAYCGDGSIEPEFFHRLEKTAYYSIRKDTLFLKQHMLATDDVPSSGQYQGVMRFIRAK